MPRFGNTLTRKEIIDALIAHGAELGRSPYKIEFQARTSIKQRHLDDHFETWNDALTAANFPPHVIKPTASAEVLDDWGLITRKLGHCPSLSKYRSSGGKFSGNAFRNRFCSWPGVGRAFFKRSVADPKWQDVIQIIKDREAKGTRPWLIAFNPKAPPAPAVFSAPSTPTNFSYGEPIDFEFLRNAPINEAGVVYLFGCLAPRLGYCVEAIQTAFPDCEAKRRDPDGRFRRLRIEFEYESKNFLLHKHDHAACDVIVCWRHNWPECPLEVVELSKELGGRDRSAA